jgi:hypothetical protein
MLVLKINLNLQVPLKGTVLELLLGLLLRLEVKIPTAGYYKMEVDTEN